MPVSCPKEQMPLIFKGGRPKHYQFLAFQFRLSGRYHRLLLVSNDSSASVETLLLFNGRRIFGGYTPLKELNLCLTSLDTKKIFCKCYQNYVRHICLKFFISQMSDISQMSGRWFPWHPKGGVYTPHKSRGVFYTHIGHGN